MIPELGHFTLILALMIAIAQMHPLLCRRAAFIQFILCLSAFLALMWSYVTSDFTVLAVAENSHTLKPLLYKITAMLTNHIGAMLFGVLILSFSSALTALEGTKQKALQIMGFLVATLIAYTLFAFHPFERIYPPPFEGMAFIQGEQS